MWVLVTEPMVAAVGGGALQFGELRGAAAAGPVFHHEGLAGDLLQLVGELAGHDVGGAAGRDVQQVADGALVGVDWERDRASQDERSNRVGRFAQGTLHTAPS